MAEKAKANTGAMVIYIAGYGRSGSTILGAALGNHTSLISVGELSFLFEDQLISQRTCSCGSTYKECSFWRQHLPEGHDAASAAAVTRRVERIWPWPPRTRLQDEYGDLWGPILQSLAQGGAQIIVDGSKTAWATARRPLSLSRTTGADVIVLHLVRDVYESVRSATVTGSNWALEGRRLARSLPGLRAAVGWLAANVVASAYGLFLPRDRYLRIRYEDFVRDPKPTLQFVGQMVGQDLSELADRVSDGADLAVGHVTGGNRLRFSSTVRLTRPTVHTGQGKAARDLPLRHRLACMLSAGWLRRLYGYR